MEIEEEHRYSYREQKLQSVHFRFDVALPMRVRYAALTAFTSTVEWSIVALKPAFHIPKTPKGKSEIVHRLEIFAERCDMDVDAQIGCFEFLTWVRNSIMHNAGALKGYKHEAQIRTAIAKFEPNFTISNWHHIGDTVEIKHGAIEPLIEQWRVIIRELYTTATNRKLLVFERSPMKPRL